MGGACTFCSPFLFGTLEKMMTPGGMEGWGWGAVVRGGGVRGSTRTGQQGPGCGSEEVRRGYLSLPSPALSMVPLLLPAAASPPFSSSVFTLLDSGCSCSSPFCLLVGREAEAEA